VPTPVDVIERYLAVLSEPDATSNQLAELLADDVVLLEHPNLLLPVARERSRAQMIEGFEAGRQLLSSQRYQTGEFIVQQLADNLFRVACTGSTEFHLAVAVGDWPLGTRFQADMAMLFDVRGELIARQEQFDCYYTPVAPSL
jgi:hypothetical protein